MPRIAFPKFGRSGFSRLLSHLPLPGALCLGLEYVENELRAALVQSKAGRREILEFVAVKTPEAGDGLPGSTQLQEIRRRLNCKQNTRSVFVTPLARVAVLPMNRERVLKMRRHVLAEAVKWEAETYTGIPGHRSLTGVEVERPRQDQGQILEESEEIMVQVAVLEQNVYRAAKERFRLAGLKLTRVYPGEACFYVPLLSRHEEVDRGVLEIGTTFSGFALLRGDVLLAINTINITTEMIRAHLDGRTRPDLENTLKFNFQQAPGPLPVALTGSGALDQRIVDFLRTLSPIGVEPVRLQRTSGLTAAGAEEGPIFATAAGAAMRELGGQGLRAIGISDAVPSAVRIRQSIYLMPVVSASFLFVVLLAHNLLMRHQEKNLQEQHRSIEAQLQERRQEYDEIKRLQGEIQGVDARIKELQDLLQYIKGGGDEPLQAKIDLYQTLARNLPDTVALIAIREDSPDLGRYVLSGEAGSISAIFEFALRLREDTGLFVDVQRLEPQPQVHRKDAAHRFVMHLEAGSGQKAD